MKINSRSLIIALLASVTPLFGMSAAVVNVGAEISALKGGKTDRKIEAARRLGKSGDASAAAALTGELSSQKDMRVRAGIVEALGNLRHKGALDELKNVLRSNDHIVVKSAAVIAMGSVGTKDAVAELRSVSSSGQFDIALRLDAMEALSRIPGDDSFAALEAAAGDKHPAVRRAAASFLWQSFYSGQKERVTGVLMALSSDKDAQVAAAARKMLELGQ